MTRPTMEELRARIGRQSSIYAGEAGTGPEGTTCHSCAHLRYTGNVKFHPKCGKTKYTHGDATTIKTRTPSCQLYEPGERATRVSARRRAEIEQTQEEARRQMVENFTAATSTGRREA